MCVNYYDISSGKKARLGGEIANSIYYDGVWILHSVKTGIFSFDTESFQCTKFILKTADSISSDGKNVVYLNGGALYLQSDGGIIFTDNVPIQYAVVSGMNKVLIYDNSENIHDIIEIPTK